MQPIWAGIGSPKPKPRMKNMGMFGYVPDAFEGKSLGIGDKKEEKKEVSFDDEKKPEENGGDEKEKEEEPEVVEEELKPCPVLEGVSKQQHVTIILIY